MMKSINRNIRPQKLNNFQLNFEKLKSTYALFKHNNQNHFSQIQRRTTALLCTHAIPSYSFVISQLKKQQKLQEEKEEQESQKYDQYSAELLKDLQISHEIMMQTRSTFEEMRINTDTFIDRSLIIKEVIKEKFLLITHPYFTGKTKNLMMIQDYFELQITNKGTLNDILQINKKALFYGGITIENGKEIELKPLAIASEDQHHCGRYPVISIDLCFLWSEQNTSQVNQILIRIIQNLYQQHKYLLNKLDSQEKIKFEKYLHSEVQSDEIDEGIPYLCNLLNRFHNIGVMIIVDEYDAYFRIHNINDQCYENIKNISELISRFLARFVNGNNDIEFVVICGTLDTLVKTNKDLNNLTRFGVYSKQIEEYFALTKEQVQEKLCTFLDPNQAKYNEKVNQIMKFITWRFSGYQGQLNKYYNIWSVFNFLEALSSQSIINIYKFQINAYQTWSSVQTKNLFFTFLRKQGGFKFLTKFINLECGLPQEFYYSNDIALYKEPCLDDPIVQEQYLSHLLFHSGFITRVKTGKSSVSTFKLPNEEIRIFFYQMLYQFFGQEIYEFHQVLEQLSMGINYRFPVNIVEYYLNQIHSTYRQTNFNTEIHYHMFFLAIYLSTKHEYKIFTQNKAGKNYPEIIILIPKKGKGTEQQQELLPIIFKLQQVPDSKSDKYLWKKAKKIQEQTQNQKYDNFIKEQGFNRRASFGISFNSLGLYVKQASDSPINQQTQK